MADRCLLGKNKVLGATRTTSEMGAGALSRQLKQVYARKGGWHLGSNSVFLTYYFKQGWIYVQQTFDSLSTSPLKGVSMREA